MNATKIKGHLAVAGYTVSELAQELAVTPAAVSQVIHGRATSRRIMLAIASKTKKSPRKLFPGKARLFSENHLTHITDLGQER